MPADTDMTIAEVRSAIPKRMRPAITDAYVQDINDIINSNEEMLEHYRENLITYASILLDGKYKVGSYINAIKYVTYKLLGDSNELAYSKTFPLRYRRYIDKGLNSRQIGSYCGAFNSTKLVSGILAQSLVPFYVTNAPAYQEALNCQILLMNNARSEKVRCDAANSVLTQLKPPEVSKIQLDIGVKEDKTIDELRQTTLELVAQQRAMIESNTLSVTQVAHSKLVITGEDDYVIEGEVIND